MLFDEDEFLEEIEDTLLAIAADHRVLPTGDLLRLARERLALREGDARWRQVEQLEEELAINPDGPLTWLAGDRTAHVVRLTAGIVLTCRLNAASRELGTLTVSTDLAGHLRVVDPELDGAPLDRISAERGHLAWTDREDRSWLQRFAVDDVLAVRVDPSTEVVAIEVLDDAPAVDPELVGWLHAAHAANLEAGLPVSFEDVLHELLSAHPHAFDQPQAPLSVLAAAAGLDQRAGDLASDPDQWVAYATRGRLHRLMGAARSAPDVYRPALDVLDLLDELADRVAVDPDHLRSALDDLRDDAVASLVGDELLGGHGLGADPGHPSWSDGDEWDPDVRLERVLQELRAAAGSGPRAVGPHLLLALTAERRGEAMVAEQHLEVALRADPEHRLVLDRLAWCASDRGDAARAHRLWSRAGLPSTDQDLRTLEPFLAATGPELGRNDPCWCESGRKHKHCHLGVAPQPSLPDRVAWLCRKAVNFVERSGGAARDDTMTIGIARAGGRMPLSAALDDPIVLDLALNEAGWFGRFLRARGPLLPEDEQLLAASWTTVERSIHEVLEVEPGVGVTTRCLRTGDTTVVRERTYSRMATVGTQLCARVVPDSESHQFVGGIVEVPVGATAQLLDVLDEGDPYAIAAWVASLEAPPELRTREGERVVECTIVVRAADRAQLLRHLNHTYRVDEAKHRWSEHHDLDEREGVVRATFRLDGDDLTISTNSNERADRILRGLRAVAHTVVRDDRTAIATPGDAGASRHGGLPDLEGLADTAAPGPEAIAQIQAAMEERWCTEAVPALGGLTPEEAAADPTRRDDLLRLLADFDAHPEPPAGAFALRVPELRRRLGLR